MTKRDVLLVTGGLALGVVGYMLLALYMTRRVVAGRF